MAIVQTDIYRMSHIHVPGRSRQFLINSVIIAFSNGILTTSRTYSTLLFRGTVFELFEEEAKS